MVGPGCVADDEDPSWPFIVFALGLSVFSRPWSQTERRYLILGLVWLLLLWGAVVFEISTDPTHWLEKSRLLWRVTLPLIAWAAVLTSYLARKYWSR